MVPTGHFCKAVYRLLKAKSPLNKIQRDFCVRIYEIFTNIRLKKHLDFKLNDNIFIKGTEGEGLSDKELHRR